MTLDETRQKLYATENELARTKQKLAALEQQCANLTKRCGELEANARKAVQLLLPEDTTLNTPWDNYQEPGY